MTKQLTAKQIVFYMNTRINNHQAIAADIAGFSERSAQRIDGGCHASLAVGDRKKKRSKPDPFSDVWLGDIEPLLKNNPQHEATFLLRELQERYPGKYPDTLLRTLQRRISDWKALNGIEKEVIFRQEHPPGFQCLADFTDDKGLNVTICGVPFKHRFYHLVSAFSRGEYIKVIEGGESFTALAEGCKEGLRSVFHGSFETHRTDSLSAAFKNLTAEEAEDQTKRYEEFVTHYGMRPTRNNKGVKHENGSVEVAHRHFRSDLNQALCVRGSRDFSSKEEYVTFVKRRMALRNGRRTRLIMEERQYLMPLPVDDACDFEEVTATVSRSGTISVKQCIYSVPSSLEGKRVRVHLYDNRIQIYFNGSPIRVCDRKRWRGGEKRPKDIDYKHLIHSLSRKPQAMRNYVHRDALFPTHVFEMLWKALDERTTTREACRSYVALLKLYADTKESSELHAEIEQQLAINTLPSVKELSEKYGRVPCAVPVIGGLGLDLSIYNELLK